MLNSNGAGADTAEQNNHDAGSELFQDASGGNVLMTQVLLSATGAQTYINLATTKGWTPLFITAKKGHSAIVAELIVAGSNIDIPTTTSGATPIFAAVENGHVDVVAQLIVARCKIHVASGCDKLWGNEGGRKGAQGCGEHAHRRAL
jgi:ankyrin repeat protein